MRANEKDQALTERFDAKVAVQRRMIAAMRKGDPTLPHATWRLRQMERNAEMAALSNYFCGFESELRSLQ